MAALAVILAGLATIAIVGAWLVLVSVLVGAVVGEWNPFDVWGPDHSDDD